MSIDKVLRFDVFYSEAHDMLIFGKIGFCGMLVCHAKDEWTYIDFREFKRFWTKVGEM